MDTNAFSTTWNDSQNMYPTTSTYDESQLLGITDHDEGHSHQSVNANSRNVGRPWTDDEDRLLRDAVEKYGDHDNWKAIAEKIPGRSNKACRKRWLHSLSPTVKKSAWTSTEDQQLIDLYQTHGPKWSTIARHIPGRTDDACSKRYREALDPTLRKDEWTPEEDERLYDTYERHGQKWGAIGQELQRSGLGCRNRWRLLERKRKTQRTATDIQHRTPNTMSSMPLFPEPASLVMHMHPASIPTQSSDGHYNTYTPEVENAYPNNWTLPPTESTFPGVPFGQYNDPSTEDENAISPLSAPFQFTSSSLRSALIELPSVQPSPATAMVSPSTAALSIDDAGDQVLQGASASTLPPSFSNLREPVDFFSENRHRSFELPIGTDSPQILYDAYGRRIEQPLQEEDDLLERLQSMSSSTPQSITHWIGDIGNLDPTFLSASDNDFAMSFDWPLTPAHVSGSRGSSVPKLNMDFNTQVILASPSHPYNSISPLSTSPAVNATAELPLQDIIPTTGSLLFSSQSSGSQIASPIGSAIQTQMQMTTQRSPPQQSPLGQAPITPLSPSVEGGQLANPLLPTQRMPQSLPQSPIHPSSVQLSSVQLSPARTRLMSLCPQEQQGSSTVAGKISLRLMDQQIPQVSHEKAAMISSPNRQPVLQSPPPSSSPLQTSFPRSPQITRPAPLEPLASVANVLKRIKKSRFQGLPRLSSVLAPSSDSSVCPYACGREACWPEGASSSIACFRTSKELFDHNKRAHPEQEAEEKPFRCALEGCGKSWKSLNGLQYHLQLSTTHFKTAVSLSAAKSKTSVAAALVNATANSSASSSPSAYSSASGATESTPGTSASSLSPTLTFEFLMPEEAEEDPTRVHVCTVPGCFKAYRQPSGLRYHQKHGHPKDLPAQLADVPPSLARKLPQKLKKMRPTAVLSPSGVLVNHLPGVSPSPHSPLNPLPPTPTTTFASLPRPGISNPAGGTPVANTGSNTPVPPALNLIIAVTADKISVPLPPPPLQKPIATQFSNIPMPIIASAGVIGLSLTTGTGPGLPQGMIGVQVLNST